MRTTRKCPVERKISKYRGDYHARVFTIEDVLLIWHGPNEWWGVSLHGHVLLGELER